MFAKKRRICNLISCNVYPCLPVTYHRASWDLRFPKVRYRGLVPVLACSLFPLTNSTSRTQTKINGSSELSSTLKCKTWMIQVIIVVQIVSYILARTPFLSQIKHTLRRQRHSTSCGLGVKHLRMLDVKIFHTPLICSVVFLQVFFTACLERWFFQNSYSAWNLRSFKRLSGRDRLLYLFFYLLFLVVTIK